MVRSPPPIARRVSAGLQGKQPVQVKKSIALYSDLKYKLTDALTLRGGLRYTHDTGTQSGFTSNAFGYDDVLVMNLIPNSTCAFPPTTFRARSAWITSWRVATCSMPA
jgi:outer membrane receptor protein involved in Fe transport